MKRLYIPLHAAALVVAAALAAPAAHAATYADYIKFCAGDGASVAPVKAGALSACGLKDGNKAACSVVSGTPFACSTPSAQSLSVNGACDAQSLTITLTANVELGGGWKVGQATGSLTYEYSATKSNAKECTLAPITPTPVGSGGMFANESGDLSVKVKITVSGSITLNVNGGPSVTLSATAGCERTTSATYYKEASANSCGPTPTPPPPTPTATTSPSPSPSTSPSPSPTSSPTPTPTTSPSPMPTTSPSASPTRTPTSTGF